MKKVDEIFIEKISHKSTLTNLFGLNKVIDKKDDVAVPLKDQEVQYVDQKVNAHCQTDERSIGDMNSHFVNNLRGKLESPNPLAQKRDSVRASHENVHFNGAALKRGSTTKTFNNKKDSSIRSNSSLEKKKSSKR